MTLANSVPVAGTAPQASWDPGDRLFAAPRISTDPAWHVFSILMAQPAAVGIFVLLFSLVAAGACAPR